jgi:hypothetical protein
MADRFYGVDKGKQYTDVTDAAVTTSKVIELRVADTVLIKSEVILALENMKNYILKNVFPPA